MTKSSLIGNHIGKMYCLLENSDITRTKRYDIFTIASFNNQAPILFFKILAFFFEIFPSYYYIIKV